MLGLLCSPPFVPVYLCANVGPQGLLVVRLPAPFLPHPASLGPATAMRVLSTLVPISAPPTGLDVCFFFIYLVLDFLAVRFFVSWLCEEAQCVYLRRHLGSIQTFIFNYNVSWCGPPWIHLAWDSLHFLDLYV